MKYLCVILAVITYLFLFYIFGLLFQEKTDERYTNILNTTLRGFFLYYTIFTLVLVPMKCLMVSLSTLTYVWYAIVLLILFLVIYKRRTEIKGLLRVKEPYWYVIFLVLLIGLQILLIIPNSVNTASSDSYLYIGNITTALYTDTIEQINPLTGMKYDFLPANRFFYGWDMQSAIICKLFSIHPLTEANYVRTTIVITLACFIQILTLKRLFKSNRTVILGLLTWIFIMFNMLGNSNASEYFYFRTYESKCVMCVIILPMLFYLFICLIQENGKGQAWRELFMVSCGAYMISTSALFVFSAALFIYGCAMFLYTKDKVVIRNIIIAFIPGIIVSIFYVIYQIGYLRIPIY